MNQPAPEPDHLVVAALTLEEGCDWIGKRLGVTPAPGGKHTSMGTHNALVHIGPRFYLEVIAIDPDAPTPGRPRWFGLDEARTKSELSEGPRLMHWAIRTSLLDSLVARVPELGRPLPMVRGDLRWRISVPDDGHLPGQGLVPTAIEWASPDHPAQRLADAGFRLVALAGEHPDPAPIRAQLAKLGQSDLMRVTSGRAPRIVAMIRTPQGTVML